MPVTRLSETTAEEFPWGTLNWLMGQAIDPDAKQTFGMAVIQPGPAEPTALPSQLRRNPLRRLRNMRTHVRATDSYQLEPGDSIRVPAGVIPPRDQQRRRNRCNAIISFSSGDRQTVFLE